MPASEVKAPTGRVTRDFPFDVQDVSDEGVVEGYASVFDVVDSEGDIISPGAFARTIQAWNARGKRIPVLWQHDAWKPIGVTDRIEEDQKGLRVRAQLVQVVQQAQEAHALAKAGALGGLSIGFSVPNLASDGNPAMYWDEDRQARVFREVKLWEYSLVTFPAQDEARIMDVRADPAWAEELTLAVRELRDAVDDRQTVALLRDLRGLMLRAVTVRPSDGDRPRERSAGARPSDGGARATRRSGSAPSDGADSGLDMGLRRTLEEARRVLGAQRAQDGRRA